MTRLAVRILLLLSLCLPSVAIAETAVFEINFLPLQEAEAVVKSQLSPSGTIVSMPSRRILLVTDDAGHIDRARGLLNRLDAPAQQYSANMELFSLSDEESRTIKTDARLPGGWIRVSLAGSSQYASSRKQYSLHITSNSKGSIETGTIQPYHQLTKQWLAGYGVINTHSVELVPITSGFHATVQPAGEGMVHVRIVPWMRNQRGNSGIRGNTEILIDLGATRTPQQAPNSNAPIQLNANPTMHHDQIIEMAGAATEVTIPVGETITITANSEEAELLGDALLSSGSTVGKQSFAIRLRIEQR